MLAVLQYSFNAVMPIILLILLGVFARRKGFLEPPMLRKVNKFNFRFNFFAMMFMNLYEVESIRQMPVRMGVFMIASHCLLVLLGIILSGFLTGERFLRGVLVQALFRSNYAIIGIPVTVALVGDIGGQIASFLQLPVVLFYNMVSLLYVAVRLGLLVVGRPEIAVVVAIFGSPLAVSSIVMANEMGGDGHLDGQIVVWSSIFGMLSLFVLISILRSRGLL